MFVLLCAALLAIASSQSAPRVPPEPYAYSPCFRGHTLDSHSLLGSDDANGPRAVLAASGWVASGVWAPQTNPATPVGRVLRVCMRGTLRERSDVAQGESATDVQVTVSLFGAMSSDPFSSKALAVAPFPVGKYVLASSVGWTVFTFDTYVNVPAGQFSAVARVSVAGSDGKPAPFYVVSDPASIDTPSWAPVWIPPQTSPSYVPYLRSVGPGSLPVSISGNLSTNVGPFSCDGASYHDGVSPFKLIMRPGHTVVGMLQTSTSTQKLIAANTCSGDNCISGTHVSDTQFRLTTTNMDSFHAVVAGPVGDPFWFIVYGCVDCRCDTNSSYYASDSMRLCRRKAQSNCSVPDTTKGSCTRRRSRDRGSRVEMGRQVQPVVLPPDSVVLMGSILASTESNWKVQPDLLLFGLDGRQSDIGVKLCEEVTISSGLDKKATYSVILPTSNKFTITCDHVTGALHPGKDEKVVFTIELHCTAVVNVGIAIALECGGSKEHRMVNVNVEGKLSTRIDLDEVTFGKPVGEGSFGVVFQGKWRGNDVAVKQLKNTLIGFNENALDDFFREIENYERLRAVTVPGKYCLVTEFCQYGSFGALMKKTKLPWYFRLKCMQDCAHGMNFLHCSNVLHRDLKPDNILVITLDPEAPIVAKLTDFGTSRGLTETTSQMKMTKGLGTPIYMAPEVLCGSSTYSKAADVWSFAIMMWEVWAEKEPYETFGFTAFFQIEQYIVSGKRMEFDATCPAEYAQLTNKCWSTEADERPAFSTIVEGLQAIITATPKPQH
eukprot:m51a1_g2600 putative tyrosine protein kinase (776) ;mRNA; r:455370-458765